MVASGRDFFDADLRYELDGNEKSGRHFARLSRHSIRVSGNYSQVSHCLDVILVSAASRRLIGSTIGTKFIR